MDDAAWDEYMERLSRLEELARQYDPESSGFPIANRVRLGMAAHGGGSFSSINFTGDLLMPVLIWSDRDGAIGSIVRTRRRFSLSAEEYRPRSRSPR